MMVEEPAPHNALFERPRDGPVTRRLEAMVRVWTFGSPRRSRQRVTAVSEEPGAEARIERRMVLIGWGLAPVAAFVVGIGLVALPADIDRSTATLVLVIPVVLVAIIGGPGPATLAAIVAPLTFDVLLTEPYYRLQIHAAEDIEATVILLIVGLVTGQLVAREVRSRARSTTRQAELQSMTAMIASVVRGAGETELAGEAVRALTGLLDLRECRWRPGYYGGAYPELTRDGEILPRPAGRTLDRAPLPPTGVELPVRARGREAGHFVLVPARRTSTSREERRVAVAIADLFGLGLTPGPKGGASDATGEGLDGR